MLDNWAVSIQTLGVNIATDGSFLRRSVAALTASRAPAILALDHARSLEEEGLT